MSNAITTRLMTVDDLEMVLRWRNAPKVCKFMFDSAEIEQATHREWFALTSCNATRRLLIVEADEIPLGFVQFDSTDTGAVSHWGFYARPDAERGAGKAIGVSALDYAFDQLELHKVCGLVLDFNEASIRMHRYLGFQQEGFLREQHRAEGLYHSVVQFGLLHKEWRAARSALMSKTRIKANDQIH